MSRNLEPPRKQALEGEQYWSWLHKLWYRTTQPAQIGSAQIAFSGTNVVLGHGTSASPAGEEFAVTGSAPINVAFGTNTITISHNTSGVPTGTYGGTAGIPRFAVNTTGHVTFADQALMAASAPIIIGTGTATMTWGHATSGVVTGTYGGATIIPQIAVNTTGHVTTVNTFALTGTAVAGADVSVTAPITISGTNTNAVLRPFTIAHATSGVVTGTYGAVNVIPQVGVNTFGHVTVVNTFGLTGTAVAGADITLTTPIIFPSGTGTNAVLRAVSIAHDTSGLVPGTFGAVNIIPQIVANTYGHVTAVNTFGLTGTAVAGADITLTTPIIFSSGTGTNAVLRAVSIAHATSGIVPGTFGAANVMTQHVVTTYGHVTAINTFALAGTNVTGGDISLTTPIIFSSGTGTNAVLRNVSIAHATSGIVPGTFGGTNALAQFVVNTYGHVTSGTSFVLKDQLHIYEGTRALPTVVGQHVDVGSFALTNGGGAIWASVVVPSAGFSVAKEYLLPINYDESSAYAIAAPIADGGPYSSQDYSMDIQVSAGTAAMRLRRTAGTLAGSAYFTIRHEGVATDTFVHSTSTGTAAAPTAYYGAAGLSQADGALTFKGNPVWHGENLKVGSPITLNTAGTGTLGHAASGIVPGTFGAVNVIPQVVVNTYGHVTAVNTFGLTGTAVTGADITLTAPIIFASGTGTNAVLRAVSISHGTSGVTPGTYGGTAGPLRVVVDTYGHVTAAVGTGAFPGATWQLNKNSVESGEALTIENNYQIVYGQEFYVNGTGAVTINGTIGGLFVH